jgi:hypothetical protein
MEADLPVAPKHAFTEYTAGKGSYLM